jgi:CheY-like chemotaxis protein
LLVVDDNETNRDVITRRLEREGYSIASAANGLRAVQMLHETAPSSTASKSCNG